MTRPTFKPAKPDNAVIHALAGAAADGTRFERPAPGAAPATVLATAPEPPAAEATKKATFDLPVSLHRKLQHAAVDQGVIMRHLILRALAEAGCAVSAEALVPDRRIHR